MEVAVLATVLQAQIVQVIQTHQVEQETTQAAQVV